MFERICLGRRKYHKMIYEYSGKSSPPFLYQLTSDGSDPSTMHRTLPLVRNRTVLDVSLFVIRGGAAKMPGIHGNVFTALDDNNLT